jgi:hypothetical protein
LSRDTLAGLGNNGDTGKPALKKIGSYYRKFALSIQKVALCSENGKVEIPDWSELRPS